MYKDLSNTELNNLLNEKLTAAQKLKIKQHAKKILLNSLYGGFGNEYFQFFSIANAEAITLTGQVVVKNILSKTNQYLNNILKTENIDRILAVDTDSCIGETEVYINNKKIQIKDFYDKVLNYDSKFIENNDINIICLSDQKYFTESYDGTNIKINKIKHVMQHRVKKRFFRIITEDGNRVIITEDHSLAIYRNGVYIPSIKPKFIKDGDEIICISGRTKNFRIDNIGIQEHFVYDLEVEKDHNFFGNNILLHNSQYLDLEDIVNAVFEGKEPNITQIVQFLESFSNEKLSPYIEKECLALCDYMNHKENFMNMKRETIAETAVWTGKKRYFMAVRDHEGVKYQEPQIYVTGIQSVSSSTPKICRGAIKEILEIILTENETNLQKYVADFKQKFMTSSIEEIAKPSGISDVLKYTNINGFSKKGSPAHVKAAINYNKLIKLHKIDNIFEKISNGSKIKWIYLKKPNIIDDNVIGFIDKFPKEFNLENSIDRELQFEKTFLKPIKDITDILGWYLEKVNTLDALF